MAHYWTRKSYDSFRGKKAGRYPVKSQGAALELRNRGIDVDYTQLKYLVSKGVVTPVGGGVKGADMSWSAKDIDELAKYLAGKGMYTPTAQMCICLNLDFGQFMEALQDASKDFKGTADATDFKMIVHPAKGSGYARVEFLPAEDGE